MAGLALVLAALLLAIGALNAVDMPPRSLALYIERRLSHHDDLLRRPGGWLAHALLEVDRGDIHAPIPLAVRLGAQADAPPLPATGATNPVPVASAEEARHAIAGARPGDVITFAPGTYRFSSASVFVTRPGTAEAGIVVRAVRPRTVAIEMDNREGFVVTAPYWRFENLTIRGVCEHDSECDHAFHVVGGASHFVARNVTLIDFNAHIKVNGQDGQFPDDGLVEGSTLTNTKVRNTDSPVTPFDLVAASRWTVRGNVITDFIKAGGDRTSYGAFAKGSGAENRFVRNVVLCEYRLRGAAGSRVGLSLGGGGSGDRREFCRDNACAIEQRAGVIESNLIAFCSDDGIYVNRGADSTVLHNTLIDTGGIVVRFVESGAQVEGNLVDGAIRSRDGAALHDFDNLMTRVAALYFGRHPQRRLFQQAKALDLAWATTPPTRHRPPTRSPPDLCGRSRPPRPVYGAFENFTACAPPAPSEGDRQ